MNSSTDDTAVALQGLAALIRCAGDNPFRDGMQDTPARFLRAITEMCAGHKEDPALHLQKDFDLRDVEMDTHYGGMIVSGGIGFVSLCEHHMLPFHGEIHICYIPKEAGKVVGLSKLARMADGFARRFQVQERLTQQIMDTMVRVLAPAGAGVVVKARHACQCFRGVRKDGFMVTSCVEGSLRDDPASRAEFLTYLKL